MEKDNTTPRAEVLHMRKPPFRRMKKTLDFLQKHHPAPAHILDLGIPNMMAVHLRDAGYTVENTAGEDLDIDFEHIVGTKADLVTAFQIFEHMVAPFNILRSFRKGQKIAASVPIQVWFRKAHWHPTDTFDRHYHEFEPRQFDMLLEKAGWKIIASEKWKIPSGKINGIRPLLRFLIPTFYIVYAEKISG